MTSNTKRYLVYGALGAVVLLLASRARAATNIRTRPVVADPFAQSQFEELIGLVRAMPQLARRVAASMFGLVVSGESVLVPAGVSYPPGSPLSDGTFRVQLSTL